MRKNIWEKYNTIGKPYGEYMKDIQATGA